MRDTLRMTFDLFLRCLKECADSIDETEFYYKNADGEDEYCIIGYITEYDPEHPYWTGTGCDIEDGAEFSSADDLVDAKIYGGQSIRDRWNDIEVVTLGMIDIEYWFKHCCPFASEVVMSEDGKCYMLKIQQKPD